MIDIIEIIKSKEANPLDNVICKLDGVCPICGCLPRFGLERECFGAKCPRCGWSSGYPMTDGPDIVQIQEV